MAGGLHPPPGGSASVPEKKLGRHPSAPVASVAIRAAPWEVTWAVVALAAPPGGPFGYEQHCDSWPRKARF